MAYCDEEAILNEIRDDAPLKAYIVFDLNHNFGLNQREIGELFGVCQQTVAGYVKTWNIPYDAGFYKLPDLTEPRIIYLACFIETDGHIMNGKKRHQFGIIFSGSDRELIEGVGRILSKEPYNYFPRSGFKKKLTKEYWGEVRIYGKDNVHKLLKRCLPYMLGRKRKIALEFMKEYIEEKEMK